jgi:hypothetical protein
MTVPIPPSDERVAKLSRAWLDSNPADGGPPYWVQGEQLDWVGRGDFESYWRFVLRLSEDVADDDTETIEQIGVDPLWTLVNYWPDAALDSIEGEAGTHSKLLQALAMVIPPTDVAGMRIDAILAAHGKTRA